MHNTVAQYLQQDFHKKIYFYWKNKLKTKKWDFSNTDISEEEFIKKYLNDDAKEYDRCKLWERGEQYANIKKIYYTQIKAQDFIQMFEAVRVKALQGDNAAVKTFMMLQKELEKSNKKAETSPEDDGLEI